MSVIGREMDAIASRLRELLPHRIITRDLLDFADRPASDLARGVICLVAQGQPEAEAFAEYFRVLLIGQIELPEASKPSAIEEAELQLRDELKWLAANPGAECLQLKLGAMRQSGQLDAPYGWISVEATVGPFDDSELWLPETAPELGRLEVVGIDYANPSVHDEVRP